MAKITFTAKVVLPGIATAQTLSVIVTSIQKQPEFRVNGKTVTQDEFDKLQEKIFSTPEPE